MRKWGFESHFLRDVKRSAKGNAIYVDMAVLIRGNIEESQSRTAAAPRKECFDYLAFAENFIFKFPASIAVSRQSKRRKADR